MRIIRETSDSVVLARYEHELRVIYTSLEVDDNEKFSVDELIKGAKEQKQRQRVFGSGMNPALQQAARKNYNSSHAAFYRRNMSATML